MPAPAGNKFWLARSSHGRAPIFASPDDLWTAATEYFEWVEANPLYEDKLVTFQGEAKHEPVAKMRAMTISGLCIFLDISRRGWDGYTAREDFVPICDKIEQIIRNQKFTGAAADLLNPSIIARDLGLADKQELTGKDGGAIEHVVSSPREIIASRLAGMSARTREDGDTSGSDGS
jgi:DNA-packaging protein gp3